MKKITWLIPTVYIVFLMLPIYWLVNMSFKTTNEILGSFTLWPNNFTVENYVTIFTDPTWFMGYVNSLTYVTINTVISLPVALPAAYALSRYRFLVDKHLFFGCSQIEWLHKRFLRYPSSSYILLLVCLIHTSQFPYLTVYLTFP